MEPPQEQQPGRSDNADEVLRAIRRILRKTSEHSRSLSRQAGLTLAQVLCLRFLARSLPDDETTVVAISRELHLAAATVSRILDRLEESGLVERQRRSRDRRKVCLALTPLGRERIEKLPLPLQEQFLARLTALSPEERLSLQRALEKIVDMMEAGGLEAAPLLEPGPDANPE